MCDEALGAVAKSVLHLQKTRSLRSKKSAAALQHFYFLLELPAATRIGIYVKPEACQARTGGIQFQRSFPGTFQAAGLLQMQNTPGWNTQRPMAHHSQ